jgi:SAM-dependent methyltransferase
MADLRSMLSHPVLYSLYQNLARGRRFYSVFVHDYVRATPDKRILDIGCGPADILEFLPHLDYVGVDMSEGYLAAARRRFGTRATFLKMRVDEASVGQLSGFDIVLAQGLLHHLDDAEATCLFRVGRAALRPGGRLVTLDGVYVPGQSRLARYLISRDRGRYVRTGAEYKALAASFFQDIRLSIRHDLFRIPYSVAIIECVRPADDSGQTIIVDQDQLRGFGQSLSGSVG